MTAAAEVRRWALRLLRPLLLLVLVVALVLALVHRGAEVRDALRGVSSALVALSFLAALASLLLSLQAWRAVVAELGSPLGFRPASAVFFVGQLGKYVPGGVWPVVVQMEMGREAGVPRSRTAVAGVVTLAVSLVVGGALGLFALPGVLPTALGLLIAAAGLLLAVLLLQPRLLTAVLGRGLRLLRRPPLERPLRGRAVLALVGWTLAASLALGLHALLLAVALGAPWGEAVVPAGAGFALALVAGLLFLPAPAGAGIREAVLVLVLAPVLDTGAALALVVVSRLLLTAADALVAAVGAAAGWGVLREVLAGRRQVPDLGDPDGTSAPGQPG